MKQLLPLALILFCMGSEGCSRPTGGRAEVQVKGNVTFNGTPVESGRILFREIEGSQQGFSGEIKQGSYSLTAVPGKMRVEITASRPIPGKFDYSNGEPAPVGEMYIPKKYNAESELTADVQAGKTNSFPFDLKE